MTLIAQLTARGHRESLRFEHSFDREDGEKRRASAGPHRWRVVDAPQGDEGQEHERGIQEAHRVVTREWWKTTAGKVMAIAALAMSGMSVLGWTIKDLMPGLAPRWVAITLLSAAPVYAVGLGIAWILRRDMGGEADPELTRGRKKPNPSEARDRPTEGRFETYLCPPGSNDPQLIELDFRWSWSGDRVVGLVPRCPECLADLDLGRSDEFYHTNRAELRCSRCRFHAEVNAPPERFREAYEQCAYRMTVAIRGSVEP